MHGRNQEGNEGAARMLLQLESVWLVLGTGCLKGATRGLRGRKAEPNDMGETIILSYGPWVNLQILISYGYG